MTASLPGSVGGPRVRSALVRTFASVLWLASLLLPAVAFAQLGPALAGRSAQAENAVVVNQNAAGLTRLPGLQVVVDTIGVISDNKFEVDDKTTTSGGNPKNDLEYAAVPQLAISYSPGDRFGPILERLSVGFGFSIPQGFGTDYGNDWAGRYFAEETTLVFVAAQPAVAARITDWLSLGAGAAIMYVESDTKVAVNNIDPSLDDGTMKLDVDGTSVGAVISALLEPTPELRFGFTYRNEIEPKLKGKPKFRELGRGLEAALDAAGLLGEQVKIKMRVPQSVQAGFYYEPIEDLAFMGDVTWVDWSRFGRIELDVGDSSTTYKVNYDDIWIASIGTQYQFTDAWRGGLGFTYISSAVSNKHRSVGLPLDEYYVFGIGGYHQMLPKLGLNANFLAVFGGPGKVDQQGQRSGRLKGKFTRRQSFALQFSLVWGEPPS